MEQKIMGWKTRGMNKDLSVSSFNQEFAFENYNLRLSTNENNTLMSWVNEKGPSLITLSIDITPWMSGGDSSDSGEETTSTGERTIITYLEGIPVGTAVLNHQLVIFTTTATEEEQGTDCIYLLKYREGNHDVLEGKLLYKGCLNLCTKHPIETLVSYESPVIQKVYWTDGYNQPRLINIAADEGILAKWNEQYIEHYGDAEYTFTQDTFFDFVPSLQGKEIFTVEKEVTGSGSFSQGVIQYCYTYINKYGQQSNIAGVSPLNYLTFADRGAAPDEQVTCTFNITIDNTDDNFDFIRLYSIQRTSYNGDVVVKQLEDIPVNNYGVSIDRKYIYEQYDFRNKNTFPFVEGNRIQCISKVEVEFAKSVNVDITVFDGTSEEGYPYTRGSVHTFIYRMFDGETYIDRSNLREGVLMSCPALYGILDSPYAKYGKYSYQLTMTGEVLEHLNTAFNNGTATQWQWALDNGTVLVTSEQANQAALADRPISFVYNYLTQRWYIAQGEVVEHEQTNPAISVNTITYIDRGDTSALVDPMELLYVGGKEITILTMADKDQTLFLGNLTQKTLVTDKLQEWYQKYLDQSDSYHPEFVLDERNTENPVKSIGLPAANGYYPYDNQLREHDSREITTFKGMETYRLGFQLQTATGEWSDPVFIDDVLNEKYPDTLIDDTKVYLPYAKCSFDIASMVEKFPAILDKCIKIRPVIVYPTINDRSVICQGVLNPTVFNAEDRKDNSPFTQASWCFRPCLFTDVPRYEEPIRGESTRSGSNSDYQEENELDAAVEYKHYKPLYCTDDYAEFYENSDTDAEKREYARYMEIQGAVNTYESVLESSEKTNFPHSNTQFFVDQSIVTLNSPEVEFDTEVQVFNMEGCNLRIIGAIPITSNISAHKIEISSLMATIPYEGSLVVDSGEDSHDLIFRPVYQSRFTGSGELSANFKKANISRHAGGRLVASFLWNDLDVTKLKDKNATLDGLKRNYLVYPWQRTGPLNNDYASQNGTGEEGSAEATSWLKEKKTSHLLYSYNTSYLWSKISYIDLDEAISVDTPISYDSLKPQVILTENMEVMGWKLQYDVPDGTEIGDVVYYPNIDKVLVNEGGYKVLSDKTLDPRVTYQTNIWAEHDTVSPVTDLSTMPVSMKYKSTSHVVIPLSSTRLSQKILPYWYLGTVHGDFEDSLNSETFWGDTVSNVEQEGIDVLNVVSYVDMHSTPPIKKLDFLWLGELYRDVEKKFGGKSKEALKANTWVPAGEAVTLRDTDNSYKSVVDLYWTQGDTYYQRYDCMKTYAFTQDDTNQNVEMLSFMCETHVNLDGRYDKNRGQIKNYSMRPDVFNLLNGVYTQQDNYFNYRQLGADNNKELSYPNQVYYTKTKNSGADVDAWTNINLGSMLELDGDKGEIKSLQRFNDQILAFQDTGISQILYNEQVQISTEQGVPIEIGNSNKVQGKRYISDTIGCSNKWSVVNTPSGIYFMDSHNKSIFLFDGKLNNLSGTYGFNTWSKTKIPSASKLWSPDAFDNFVAYYDKKNQDILFISKNECLAFSERLGSFTSFYSYQKAPYFCNLDDTGLWIEKTRKPFPDGQDYRLWRQNAGNYCNFFDSLQPYRMTLVGNPEPLRDKIFTNLDFRATIDSEGTYTASTGKFTPYIPFDSLEVWNEYQHGNTKLSLKNGMAGVKHDTYNKNASNQSSSIKRKFRIWHCDIPRDNALINPVVEAPKGIFRYKVKPMDRMRNPWIYLTLEKGAVESMPRAEIHDMTMSYYVGG